MRRTACLPVLMVAAGLLLQPAGPSEANIFEVDDRVTVERSPGTPWAAVGLITPDDARARLPLRHRDPGRPLSCPDRAPHGLSPHRGRGHGGAQPSLVRTAASGGRRGAARFSLDLAGDGARGGLGRPGCPRARRLGAAGAGALPRQRNRLVGAGTARLRRNPGFGRQGASGWSAIRTESPRETALLDPGCDVYRELGSVPGWRMDCAVRVGNSGGPVFLDPLEVSGRASTQAAGGALGRTRPAGPAPDRHREGRLLPAAPAGW